MSLLRNNLIKAIGLFIALGLGTILASAETVTLYHDNGEGGISCNKNKYMDNKRLTVNKPIGKFMMID